MSKTSEHELYEVVITAIVCKNDKYLIIRRSKNKKRFPGYWIFPGGHLEPADYIGLKKETEFYWYNVLERTLKREVKEEVGITIKNIEYITSLVAAHEDGNNSIVISCMANYSSGKVKLQKDEAEDYVWVTLKEAKKYKLIDGTYEELVIADNKRKGVRSEWYRN